MFYDTQKFNLHHGSEFEEQPRVHDRSQHLSTYKSVTMGYGRRYLLMSYQKLPLNDMTNCRIECFSLFHYDRSSLFWREIESFNSKTPFVYQICLLDVMQIMC